MAKKLLPSSTTDLIEADALDQHLTGQPALDRIATALHDAAFAFDPDDLMVLATAEHLEITDADDYARGFEYLDSLTRLEKQVTQHYSRFDKPLNFLIGLVRGLKGPQVQQITPIKQALSKRLGTWKAAQEAADRRRRAAEQERADQLARAEQEARAQILERIAQAEIAPDMAAAFQAEAESVRAVQVQAPPVPVQSTVPAIPGGYTRLTWKAQVTDLKALLTAYVEGRCILDEAALIDGVQSFLDKQASTLGARLGEAYPGTSAQPIYGAVRRVTRS